MFDLLIRFEDLIVLKTVMEQVDMNFLNKTDLDRIAEYAENLEVKIKTIEGDDLEAIYSEWFEEINSMYLEIKEELFRCF